MKKRLFFMMMALVLVFTVSVAMAENWYCPKCGRSNTDNFCPKCGTARPSDLGGSSSNTSPSYSGMWLTATRAVATRTGPSTDYSEPGSFGSAGMQYRVLSRNDIWVQVEVTYRGMLFRAYTGIQRFNCSNYEWNSLPVERVLYSGMINQYCTVMSGPGDQYTYLHAISMDEIYGVNLQYGARVSVCAQENGYAQIDFYQNGTHYRGWVPEYIVSR